MPVTVALRGQRQDEYEFKAGMDYIVRPCPQKIFSQQYKKYS
jgi:hypothetical protein